MHTLLAPFGVRLMAETDSDIARAAWIQASCEGQGLGQEGVIVVPGI